MSSHVEIDPGCSGIDAPNPETGSAPLTIERTGFDALDAQTWDRLAAANPFATPFSRWAFHRAWWDSYGPSAHDETMVARKASGDGGADVVAIVPLMHRHEVEPTDAQTATRMRHARPPGVRVVAPTAKAIFLGASYHADYQTLLGPPDSLPAVADAVAEYLATGNAAPSWDLIDLRRLRCGDPAATALVDAFGARAEASRWAVDVEREDVCPVVRVAGDVASVDEFLSTLSKKQRHEIRRKVRRSEAAGETCLVDSEDPVRDLDSFVDLHQRRWGPEGLFPDGPGGEAGRTFFRRLFELFGPETLRLSFLEAAGQRIAAAVWFLDPDRAYFYNAGIDPDARALSPGVVLVERLLRRLIEEGRRELDFLRGDESYKYGWGAVDEPIERLIVARV